MVEVKQSVAHRVAERVVDRAATFVPDSALVKGDGIRGNGGGGAAREESAEDEEEKILEVKYKSLSNYFVAFD